MTMREFIRENREELGECIKRVVGKEAFIDTNEERRLWIANDESLYNWARSEGVRV